ncbi:GNAT family N-acetyltransferase [Streptomyces sp. NBC_00286]
MTYQELERASRSLAARIAALDLPAGSTVALCLPRSARFVEAALAVLRCGLAFLPVDVEQPPRRRAFILSDAGAAAVIVDPDAIAESHRQGIGRLLIEHIIATARKMELVRVSSHADQNAEPFYRAMGAKRIGTTPSGSIGRVIPLMLAR